MILADPHPQEDPLSKPREMARRSRRQS
jgi:hypothetical protein